MVISFPLSSHCVRKHRQDFDNKIAVCERTGLSYRLISPAPFKDAIDGLLLELEEKVGNPTFQLPMLEVFYARARL